MRFFAIVHIYICVLHLVHSYTHTYIFLQLLLGRLQCSRIESLCCLKNPALFYHHNVVMHYCYIKCCFSCSWLSHNPNVSWIIILSTVIPFKIRREKWVILFQMGLQLTRPKTRILSQLLGCWITFKWVIIRRSFYTYFPMNPFSLFTTARVWRLYRSKGWWWGTCSFTCGMGYSKFRPCVYIGLWLLWQGRHSHPTCNFLCGLYAGLPG